MVNKLLSTGSVIGLLALAPAVRAQVGIGTATPDASAVLDLRSSTKGLLAPRMTASQVAAIPNPADGLLVYQTDGLQPGLRYFRAATGWTYLNPTGADNLGSHSATQALTMNGLPINFGTALTQQLNLWGADYAIGIQPFTLMFRSGSGFAWYRGGSYVATQNDAGGGSAQMMLSDAGNLGLGIGAASPEARLHVGGTLRLDGGVIQRGGAPIASTADLGLYSRQSGTWMRFVTNSAPIRFYSDDNIGTTANLTIESNGNVGIGTTSPRGRLDVASGDTYLVGNVNSGSSQSLFLPGHVYLAPNNGSSGTAYLQARIPGASSSTNIGLTLRTTDAGNIVETLQLSSSGNVGIGTAATNRLDVSNAGRVGTHASGRALYATGDFAEAANGVEFRHSNGTQGIGFGYNSLYAAGTNPDQHLNLMPKGSGNVGIGTTTPQGRLDVASGSVRLPGAGGGDTWFNFSGNNQNYLRGTTIIADLGGNVGIGTSSPSQKLHVAGQVYSSTGGFRFPDNTVQTTAATTPAPQNLALSGQNLSISGGNTVTLPVGADNLGNHTATQNLNLGTNQLVGNGGTAGLAIASNGNVGIGTTAAPAAKLEVASGEVRLPGGGGGLNTHFNYVGNGKNYIRGTTVLADAGGFVGIGTADPTFPLDVQSLISSNNANYVYYGANGSNGTMGYAASGGSMSIRAAGRVVAPEFNATSDRRLKTVIGLSDRSADLALLSKIRITDYTMRDRVQYGNRQFKKVIAQEVEEVFPQAVNRQTGFLPDVYALATTATAEGDLLRLTLPQTLAVPAPAGARLKLLGPQGEVVGTVARAASGRTLLVRGATQLAGQQVFVFGLEHADVRTVDYEALAMLNVSATQELARQVAELQAQNAAFRQTAQAQSARLDQQQAALQALQTQEATRTAELAQRLKALENLFGTQASAK